LKEQQEYDNHRKSVEVEERRKMPPGFLTAEQHKQLREEALKEFRDQKHWTKQQAK